MERAPDNEGLGLGLVIADIAKHLAAAHITREGLVSASADSKSIIEFAYKLTMDIQEKISEHYKDGSSGS